MLYPAHYGGNPLFPQASDFTVVRRNEEFGMGVICKRAFRAGELVAEITGEILDEITQHTLQIDAERHLLDLHFTGYLLHSCDPNVSVDMQNMRVTALRDIQPGDYLSMDYAETEEYLYRQFACCCGASNCRGWIMGSKDVVNESEYREQHRHSAKAQQRAR